MLHKATSWFQTFMLLRQIGVDQSDAYSLVLRRSHGDLIMCYKFIYGHVECERSDLFTLHSSSVTRGHVYKMHKHHNQNSVRKSFFTERIFDSSNFLPICMPMLNILISINTNHAEVNKCILNASGSTRLFHCSISFYLLNNLVMYINSMFRENNS